MGVEKQPESSNIKANKNNSYEKYRPPALRNTEVTNFEQNTSENKTPTNSSEISNETITSPRTERNTSSVRRERRPDRAVYVPRARRSITSTQQIISISSPPPPSSSSSSLSLSSSVHKTSDETRTLNNHQKRIVKENLSLSSNSVEIDKNCSNSSMLLSSVITNKNCDNKNLLKENKNQLNKSENRTEKDTETEITKPITNSNFNKNCDRFEINPNFVNKTSTNFTTNNIMNTNNKTTKSEQNTENSAIRIEDARSTRTPKKENDIDELQRASKEINRSNRRIIKQTFNSDVLEIPENLNVNCIKNDNNDLKKKIDPENDDWDAIYDENGECFDPKIIEELTACVGKVKIETPKADYSAYLLKQAILSEEEFPHVLEISNFPVEFKTQDLMMIFSVYKESGFDIKWVDDTHALAVFSSSRIAAEVLAMGHPFVVLKPLAEATLESRTKAKKSSSSLQPYRPRPETCAALARRLVTGALGVRLKTAAEERENEKRVLKEAKERKLLAAKQRDEVWES